VQFTGLKGELMLVCCVGL